MSFTFFFLRRKCFKKNLSLKHLGKDSPILLVNLLFCSRPATRSKDAVFEAMDRELGEAWPGPKRESIGLANKDHFRSWWDIVEGNQTVDRNVANQSMSVVYL